MKNTNPETPRILIIGAKGMLGRTVFNYLIMKYPNTIWGTYKINPKKNERIMPFDANNYTSDFRKIIKKIKKINYVINCIGIVNGNEPPEELIYINSLFPHILEKYSQKYKFNLIHVSSDAVFPKLSGLVTEKSKASPEDIYGMSKMLGETTWIRAITIRTSILGFDPNNHRGLLEDVKRAKKNIKGYANQTWSGCTVLQFAKLCEWIIQNDKFQEMRKFSNIIHFSPLIKNKYNIIKSYLSLIPKKYLLKKANSTKITRYLGSEYFDLDMLKMYNANMQNALAELINFEDENAGKK